MKLTKREVKIYQWAKKFYSQKHEKIDRVHQWDHIMRVFYNMNLIQKKEKGDLRILIPAIFLHDIGQAYDDSPDQTEHAAISAKHVAEILREFGYNENEVLKICETIELHSSRYTSVLEMTNEGKIIFDADKIDAVGVTAFYRWAKKFYQLPNKQIAEHMLFTYKKWAKKLGEKIFYTKTGQLIGQQQLKESIRFAHKVIKEEGAIEKFFFKTCRNQF